MTIASSFKAADLTVLRRVVERPGQMAALIAATAEAADLTIHEMLSRSRRHEICGPRHVAIVLCLEVKGATLSRVASLFRLDRTTIINAQASVAKRMNPELAAAMDRIRMKARLSE